MCIPSLEVRLAQPDSRLGLHDPGQPWAKWGCPIEGCGTWFPGKDLEVTGEVLEFGQQVSYRYLRSVARQALYVILSQGSGVVAIRPFGR